MSIFTILSSFALIALQIKHVISNDGIDIIYKLGVPESRNADPISICSGTTITGTAGTIATPGWPSVDYPANQHCNKTINIPPNKILELIFSAFRLETEDSCTYDYVEIYADQELYGNSKYCGSTAPRIFRSREQTSVTVVFHSDQSEQDSGFLLTWMLKDRCNVTEFTCWDTTCIPASKQCDGIRDCTDDSDEIECAKNPSSLAECGKQSTSPQFPWASTRIVGGSTAQPGAWPWQVALFTNPVGSSYASFFCGGSVLNEEWVLSAAHCVSDTSKYPDLLVKVGSHTRSGSDGQSFRVNRVYVHPSYNTEGGGLHNDVALIRIDGRISWTDSVRPICIPATDTLIPSGTVCIATGWGSLYDQASVLPDTLMQVRLPVVSRFDCGQAYGAEIDSEKMCTGDKIQGGIDTCSGDSGGPLVCLLGEKVWVQAGITSYGIGCGNKDYPGVYARVATHTTWINSILSEYNNTASLADPNHASSTNVSLLLLPAALLVILSLLCQSICQ